MSQSRVSSLWIAGVFVGELGKGVFVDVAITLKALNDRYHQLQSTAVEEALGARADSR